MKTRGERFRSLHAQPLDVLQRVTSRRNAILLLRLSAAFVVILTIYSALFYYLMHLEHQRHSLLSSVYWIISTMTTLGLGDIAFTSDAGRLFTVLVVCTGIFFFLALLPFTIFQLFQSSARIPREVPRGTSGHVILTAFTPLTSALIQKLVRFKQNYVLLTANISEAVELRDLGIRTVIGELDDPATYRELQIDRAAYVAATSSDVVNTSIAYSVRQVSKDIPLFATASGAPSNQILSAAGCTQVVTLDHMMGQSLARRTVAGDAMAHVIEQIDGLVIAESTAAGTPLVGKTLREADLRRMTGVCVVGVWEEGRFSLASEIKMITSKSVLVIAGSQEQIDRFNELFCIYNISGAPILIIGGGNVGRAMGQALQEREIDFRIIEKSPTPFLSNNRLVQGDATDVEVLRQAGFFTTPAVAITTHHDPTNIYLATYYRQLRSDIQIISRATSERTIEMLHSAGCDFVVSYASLGANAIFNLSKRGKILMVAEGVDIFKVRIPQRLVGKNIAASRVREDCDCSIIGVGIGSAMTVNPGPEMVLPADADMVLIGSVEGEERFLERYRPPSTA